MFIPSRVISISTTVRAIGASCELDFPAVEWLLSTSDERLIWEIY